MAGTYSGAADATALINDAKQLPQHQENASKVIAEAGAAMARGWKDPDYAKAFSGQMNGAESKSLMSSLGLPSADDIFAEPPGQTIEAGGHSITHGGPDDAPVTIIKNGKDNQAGRAVTYVDAEGKTQSFEQTKDGVVVNTDGKPKTYKGAKLEVDPDTQEPIIHQGDAKTTVLADGTEQTELNGNTITRDKDGNATAWTDGKGHHAVNDGKGNWSMVGPDGKELPMNVPPGGHFAVSPDGRPGFTIPGKQDGGITAEVNPETGKVDRYNYPDGSSFYYDAGKNRWMHHDQHDQGADKDQWVTEMPQPQDFKPNNEGIYTLTWQDVAGDGQNSHLENRYEA